MKKGFTLIELLAVIVVLSIISLIAIPKLTKVIETSKENAALLGAESYTRAVESYSIRNDLKGVGSLKDGTYEIGSLNIDINGNSPKSGIFTVKGGKVVDAKLCINGFSLDVINNHSKKSDNNYCANSDATISIYTIDKSFSVNGSKQRKFTIDTDKYSVVHCNNGSIPVVTGNTLYVLPTSDKTTCYLDTDLFQMVQYSDKTKVTADVFKDNESSSRWALNDYKDITINMHNHKYKSNSTGNSGTIQGKLVINADENAEFIAKENLFTVTSTGSLTINGGKYRSLSDIDAPANNIFLFNSGKLVVNYAEFETINMMNIQSQGTLIINDGLYKNERIGTVAVTAGKGTINGGYFESSSKSNTAVSAQGSGDLTINNATILGKNHNGVVSYGTKAKLTINNAKITTNAVNAVSSYGGTLVINNVYAYSKTGNALSTSGGETTNVKVHGGVYISDTKAAIVLSGPGSFIIDQKDKPVYISTHGNGSDFGTITNSSNGTINIKGSIADKCTKNYKDTKSGLCVYSEGTGEFGSNTSQRALLNWAGSTAINIDGGSYISGYITISNTKTGIINIKNAFVKSGNTAIFDQQGSINICSSEINGKVLDINGSTNGKVNIKNLKNTSIKKASTINVNESYTGNCDEVYVSE